MSAIGKPPHKPGSKLQLKSPATVTLDKIIGHTVSDKYRIAIHPKTGDIAYLCGSIICIVNPKSAQPIKHFFNKSNRNYNSLAYSSSGDYLAAGEASCKQPEIAVFEPFARDEPVAILKGHKSGIKALAFSPDGEHLVSVGEQGDTRIVLWDWRVGKRVDSKKMKREFCSLEFPLFGNYFVTTGAQSMKFWSIEDNAETRSKVLVCKSADMGTRKDKIFIDACCGTDLTYTITESPASLCIVNKERKMEKWMDLKADKGFACKLGTKYILCACSDSIIRLFDPVTLQHIATLPKPPPLGGANVLEGNPPAKMEKRIYADTVAIQLDEANGIIAAVYSDRSFITWDIKVMSKITMKRSFMPHSAPINDIQILPSSTPSITKFATCSSDCTVRFWHISDKALPTEVPRNAYCKDMYQLLYTAPDHSHFKLRAIQQSVAMNQDGQMRCLKVSPDGKYVVCGDQNGSLKVYDTESWTLIKDIQAHNGEVTCIDFVQDGNLLLMASGSRDRLIHLFDCKEDFVRKGSIEDQNSAIIALAFAVDKSESDPNHRIRLITCSADKCIIFRYIGQDLTAVKYHQEIDKQCKPLCLSTNPHALHALAGQEKKISIWRISSGKPLRTFELKVESGSHPISNISIIVDPTSSIIITSCSDKVIKARDFTNGKCILKITNAGYTSALAFTPDLKKLITVSMEGCIMVWSLPEELVAHCQKRMVEMGISQNLAAEPLKKASKDKIIAEWEGVAGISPEKERQKVRAKEAKESSEIAMNAAAYVQNLLAKIKPPVKEDEEEKEEEAKEEGKNTEMELSEYSIKERPKDEFKDPAPSETNTEFEKETNKDFPLAEKESPEIRLSQSLPTKHRQEIEEPSPAPMPEESQQLINKSRGYSSQRNLPSAVPDVSPFPNPIPEKEEDKTDSQNEALALEEETQTNEEIDVLGQLLLQQRDVPDENVLKIPAIDNMKKRESLTSKFWKEKLQIDDELKSAYQMAHKNPHKRDKRNLIFPSQELENLQGKLPNYKEAAANYESILKDFDLSKEKKEPEKIDLSKEKKEPEKIDLSKEKKEPEEVKQEKVVEKKKVEKVDAGTEVEEIKKENMGNQTETIELIDEFKELFTKFKQKLESNKMGKEEGKQLMQTLKPIWDEANKQVEIKVDPLEEQAKDLLERYSMLLLGKVQGMIGK